MFNCLQYMKLRFFIILVPYFLVKFLFLGGGGGGVKPELINLVWKKIQFITRSYYTYFLFYSLCRFDGDGCVIFCNLILPVFLSSFLEERILTYNFSTWFPLQNTINVSLFSSFNMWVLFWGYWQLKGQYFQFFHNESNKFQLTSYRIQVFEKNLATLFNLKLHKLIYSPH